MFNICNGYENIDSNYFFKLKQSKITGGHNFTLVKKQSRLDVFIFTEDHQCMEYIISGVLHASCVNI